MSIGTFGPITFEVSATRTRTFTEFSRQTTAKFEEHAIIGMKSKLEFVAPGLDEISFQVVFSAFHGLNPTEEVNQLREIIQNGEYYPLLIGGKVIGAFVIESMSEAWRHVDNRGLLLYVAVDLNLKENFLDAAEMKRISDDAEAQAAQVIPEVIEQAEETGLSIDEITNLAAMAINGVRDPALAVPAIQAILTATQKQQNGEMYSSLGLDLAALAVQAKTNPYGALTGTLDRLANTETDKPSAAKTIYGAKMAGSVLQIARQLKR